MPFGYPPMMMYPPQGYYMPQQYPMGQHMPHLQPGNYPFNPQQMQNNMMKDSFQFPPF